jgi:hypothetical protein
MNYPRISIVFATTSLANATGLIHSVKTALTSHTLNIAALLIGQKDRAEVVSLIPDIDIIGCYDAYLPIHESRNICQSYLHQKMLDEQGIGLVLDDDLEWIMEEDHFSKLVQQLRNVNCDIAFSALSGDAPIPKEYTRASALLDVMLSIHEQDAGVPDDLIGQICHQVTVTTDTRKGKQNTHHDYYAFNKENFNRVPLDITNIDWEDTLRKLYIGKSTTRPVYTNDEITEATGRERGGATLVLNCDVLALKNHSMQCGAFMSRRSDMLMATDVKDEGFRLFATPAILAHERNESFDSHDVKKLIGDILGYALVEAKVDGVFSESEFSRCYSERMARTKAIISDTTMMLVALGIWLESIETVSRVSKQLIHEIIGENGTTLNRLNEISACQILQGFNSFKTNSQHSMQPLEGDQWSFANQFTE